MAARKDGHYVEFGDSETYVASEAYDVFAGDLIEYLSPPGLFLLCAYKNLAPAGTLARATPNTYSLAKMARVIGRITNEPALIRNILSISRARLLGGSVWADTNFVLIASSTVISNTRQPWR